MDMLSAKLVKATATRLYRHLLRREDVIRKETLSFGVNGKRKKSEGFCKKINKKYKRRCPQV